MMLKNVVLPAPFGPMRLTIDFSGIVKSTLLTAMRPPNRLVTRGVEEVGHGYVNALGRARLLGIRRDRRPRRALRRRAARPMALAREKAFWAKQHHQHEGDPVQQELNSTNGTLTRSTWIGPMSNAGKPISSRKPLMFFSTTTDHVDHERADSDAPDIAHAAEDHHRQDGERHGEQELVGRHDGQLRRVVDAGQAGRRRTEGECRSLDVTVLMPFADAASSSSRMAFHDRPMRRSCMRYMKIIAIVTMKTIR